nr:hypothetical protein [uncultured Rhodopila sp.]
MNSILKTTTRPFVSSTALAAVWLLVAAPCTALECPKPQPAGTPGVIRETPSQIKEVAPVLASGDLGPRVPMIIQTLRSRHPGVPADELVSYLVTAYCPVVKQQRGLSDAQRHELLSAFTADVMQAAY